MNAKKLKALREANNLMQKDMADILGVTRKVYEKWEHGDRHLVGATIRLIEVLFPGGKLKRDRLPAGK